MRLKQARLQKGMKQTEVIAALRELGVNITVADLSRYENGVSAPTKKQRVALRNVLAIEPRPQSKRACRELKIRLPQPLADAVEAEFGGLSAAREWIIEVLAEMAGMGQDDES